MQSTPSKPKRNSSMKLTFERRAELNVHGSLDLLYNIVELHKINITCVEFMNTLRNYCERFTTQNQRDRFTEYYMRRMSISEIRTYHRFTNWSDVERPLKSATDNYIRMLIEDYGTK